MNWQDLQSINQFDELYNSDDCFAVFKHSTRCSISSTAKSKLERQWNLAIPIYYLDLLKHRDVSNHIAQRANIQHESPQLIVIKQKEVVYNASHLFIDVDSIPC